MADPSYHICDRCGKTFIKAVQLKRHLERKTPCKPIIEEADLSEAAQQDPNLNAKKCRFCGRAFSSRGSMLRHIRQSCKIAPNEKNGDEGMEVLYNLASKKKQAELEAEIEARVEAKVAARMKEMLGVTPRLQRGGNIAIHGDHCQVNNITIKVFGRESQDHITVAQIKEVLDRSLRAPGIPTAIKDAILQVAMLVYSDASHPENITAYLPNKKTDDVLVHGENGWEVRPARLVLRPMAETTIDALFDKQPHENAERYSPLMQELRSNEQKYSEGTELRPLLVRNKDLLTRNNKDGGGEQP